MRTLPSVAATLTLGLVLGSLTACAAARSSGTAAADCSGPTITIPPDAPAGTATVSDDVELTPDLAVTVVRP